MRIAILIILALAGSACRHAPHRIPDLETLLAIPSDGSPWRLQVQHREIQAVTIGIPRHTVPSALARQAQSLLPDAHQGYSGREWGPQGSGYRLEFLRQSGEFEELHSLLLEPSGAVLDYRRSAPLRLVPVAVLGTALTIGPQIEQAQVCTAGTSTHVWHCTVIDAQGRRHISTIAPDGDLVSLHQIVPAEIHWQAEPRRQNDPSGEL